MMKCRGKLYKGVAKQLSNAIAELHKEIKESCVKKKDEPIVIKLNKAS